MLDYMIGVMGYDSLNESTYDEWLEENMDASEEEKAAKKQELEEDFLNRRYKPAKNQKNHLNYMKNKMHSNKTNGATDQSELPKFNQFGE